MPAIEFDGGAATAGRAVPNSSASKRLRCAMPRSSCWWSTRRSSRWRAVCARAAARVTRCWPPP